MSTDLLRAARAEEQRLLRELESTPLYRRLEAIRALLSEYESRSPNPTRGHPAAVRASTTPTGGTRREGGLTKLVIDGASDHLRAQQRRAQSAEILDFLLSRGIQVTGQKPTAVVASILSNCDLFNNVRGEGYGLVEWGSGLPLRDSDRPAGGGEPEADDRSAPNEEPNRQSGLDSLPDLVSNRSWATNDDRSRPNPGQNF